MWGPGDMDQWHSEDERISVNELQSGARGYFGLIREYLC
jgi:acetylornithine deacetylase/succinyl-diaminopimelate desuccinylase-like protein